MTIGTPTDLTPDRLRNDCADSFGITARFDRNTHSVSAYEWLRTGVGEDEYDWAMSEKIRSLGDFTTFVHWIRDTNASEGMHFLPQHSYVNTDESEMGMDFVGRFETLAEDVSFVARRLGVSTRLPHLNASPSRRPYQEYFDAESVDIVGKAYRKDVELFGYGFSDSGVPGKR